MERSKANDNRRRLEAHLEIAKEIPKRLAHLHDYYFGASSLFLQERAVDLAWLWIMNWRNNVSGASYKWSCFDQPHRIHRLLLARYPAEIANTFVREQWQLVFRTFCHLQLRDGAVLYIVFVPGHLSNLEELRYKLNFSYFKSGALFPLFGFWNEDYTVVKPVSGADAGRMVKLLLSEVPKDQLKGAIRLWYDDRTFVPERRPKDALYKSQRHFVYELFAGECQSPRGGVGCSGRVTLRDGHVDHIVSLAKATNVLLNLTWLCDGCNLAKRNMDTHAVPLERAWDAIPREWGTGDIRDGISFAPPEWLRLYRGPPKPVLADLWRGDV